MRQSKQPEDIPTELLRTFMVCVDATSFTKAAAIMGITQAAVSSRISRLSTILRSPVFEKSGRGVRLTQRGNLLIGYAGRIVSMNDQLLAASGRRPGDSAFRIGVPNWMSQERLVEAIRACERAHGQSITFRSEGADALKRDIESGQVDLVIICSATDAGGKLVREWSEPLFWITAPDFRLAPDKPVPLVGCTGSLSDRVAGKALEDANLSHNVSFFGSEVAPRMAAVAAGIGVMIGNERSIGDGLIANFDQQFPKLPPIRMGIYIRADLDRRSFNPVVSAFTKIMAPRMRPSPVLVDEPARRRSAANL